MNPLAAVKVIEASPFRTKVPTPLMVTWLPQFVVTGLMMQRVRPDPVTLAGDRFTGVVVIVIALLPAIVGAGAGLFTTGAGFTVTVKVAATVVTPSVIS
jgi:hypothetical protein